MDKIASVEESHYQGDVNKNMTRDVEEEPIAICHMRKLKCANFFFFQSISISRGKGADSSSCRRLGY